MEWINAHEAARLSGRNRRNIYVWARKGYVQSQVFKLNNRQTVGRQLFLKRDILKVCHILSQGKRLDLFSLAMYKPEKIEITYTPPKKKVQFTDRQLEIARRVLENA